MKDFCEKPKTIKFSIIKGASFEILNPDCVRVIFFYLTVPHRETVAGEATSKSSGSKIKLVVFAS